MALITVHIKRSFIGRTENILKKKREKLFWAPFFYFSFFSFKRFFSFFSFFTLLFLSCCAKYRLDFSKEDEIRLGSNTQIQQDWANKSCWCCCTVCWGNLTNCMWCNTTVQCVIVMQNEIRHLFKRKVHLLLSFNNTIAYPMKYYVSL